MIMLTYICYARNIVMLYTQSLCAIKTVRLFVRRAGQPGRQEPPRAHAQVCYARNIVILYHNINMSYTRHKYAIHTTELCYTQHIMLYAQHNYAVRTT